MLVNEWKEIMARNKTKLDIFWLKDKSLADPDILAYEIIENLQAGLDRFKEEMDTLMGKAE